LDAVAIRSSVRLGGVTEIAVAHLDTLSGFEKVGICTAYRVGDRILQTLPASAEELAQVSPVVEMQPGWQGDLRGVQNAADLPAPALAFLRRLEEAAGAPVTIVSVGPERSQTVFFRS
jgi:adenylosuccinate synthase